jgi:hypothetical protein
VLYIIGEDGAWGGSEIVGDRSDHMRASCAPALQPSSWLSRASGARKASPAANTQPASLDARNPRRIMRASAYMWKMCMLSLP